MLPKAGMRNAKDVYGKLKECFLNVRKLKGTVREAFELPHDPICFLTSAKTCIGRANRASYTAWEAERNCEGSI